jgi:hypothetical protein
MLTKIYENLLTVYLFKGTINITDKRFVLL